MSSHLRPPPITTSHSAPDLTQTPFFTPSDTYLDATYHSDDSSSSFSSSSDLSLPPSLYPSFAPPFYNRPPTPLPPSPSLTSLLRPPFTPSRPTTSDESDSEAVASSDRFAQHTPRASPRVPTYEYYGFVLYLGAGLAIWIYVLWAYLPTSALHWLGIHYYPNRWWALAIPSFLVMTIVYIYIALASYNTGYLTRPFEAIECIVDTAAQVASVPPTEEIIELKVRRRKRGKRRGVERVEEVRRKRDWKALWNRGTDAVMDVPVGGVCEILYGEGREESEDESWSGHEGNAAVNSTSSGSGGAGVIAGAQDRGIETLAPIWARRVGKR